MDHRVEASVTPADAQADVELMARVAARDPSAQRTVVQRLARCVRKVTGLLCRSRADADDAAQLALIEILRSARSFRVATSLERWAERVTVRATLKTARRERARKGLLERWLPADVQPWGSSATEPAVDEIGLDALLQRLSSDRYQVFVLHHALDYTVEEISELTGAPVGTVKDRLVTARKQLRRLLDLEHRTARGRLR
jgi:RNA polymerase sigma-70 factor (ECF subfamily)